MTGYLIYEASKARAAEMHRVAEEHRLARATAGQQRAERGRFPRIRGRVLRRPRTA
jgi:hypothetical protein